MRYSICILAFLSLGTASAESDILPDTETQVFVKKYMASQDDLEDESIEYEETPREPSVVNSRAFAGSAAEILVRDARTYRDKCVANFGLPLTDRFEANMLFDHVSASKPEFKFVFVNIDKNVTPCPQWDFFKRDK